jgi:drug/metabolite transporter (DMT)-like permease
MLCGRDLTANVAGTLLLLGGSACWSLGTVLARRLSVAPGAAGFGSEMLCAGVVSCGVSLALREHWTLHFAPQVWAAWGYLVAFGSVIGFSAYRFIVERLSPTLAATYAYVNPPVGLLTGWGLGGERFSPLLLLGLPVVLVAVGLQTWLHTRTAAAARGQASAGRRQHAPN